MIQLLLPDTLSKMMNNNDFDIWMSFNPAGIGLDISQMGFELDQVITSSENGRCFLDVAIGDGMDFQPISDLFLSMLTLKEIQ